MNVVSFFLLCTCFLLWFFFYLLRIWIRFLFLIINLHLKPGAAVFFDNRSTTLRTFDQTHLSICIIFIYLFIAYNGKQNESMCGVDYAVQSLLDNQIQELRYLDSAFQTVFSFNSGTHEKIFRIYRIEYACTLYSFVK